MKADRTVASGKTVHALLNGLIDYAGLFPPARLDMSSAVRKYLDHASGPHAWMLGRFVVPVSRLAEFGACLGDIRALETTPARTVELSVLAGEDATGDSRAIEEFNRLFAGRISIRSMETKAASVFQVERLMDELPKGIEVYVELHPGDSLQGLLDTLAPERVRAKLRTGGITPEAIPPAAAVLRFMDLCDARGLAFKATAGLHHAIRSAHPLTYEPGSECATMHGFLNVFLAAAWLRKGTQADRVAEILEETNAAVFVFTDRSVRCRNLELQAAEIAESRRNFAISFGSCSFTEPVADLQALGLLKHDCRHES